MFRELYNVLGSVMNKDDLISFLSLKKMERYQSLVNLREIVCGIYVFNSDAGLCEEGVIDGMYQYLHALSYQPLTETFILYVI